ncbi:MAG TPA: CBS domain-containing protein [Nitrososphaeraceae archaeon]|nr:CBS domain-containing protein [Nitrososphaeraceae archaeon]
MEELFSQTLFETPCISVDKNRDIWVAIEMCAQYLESAVDAIIVVSQNNPIGTIGGREILSHLRKNTIPDSYFRTKIEDIFFNYFPQVEGNIKFDDLMNKWKSTGRAFSIISNQYGDYFSISSRKMLEIGKRYKSGISVSSIPKKKIVTFKEDEPLGDILNRMFKNHIRRILLENSNQFISDRIILGEISMLLKYQDIDNLLDIPINQFKFEYIKEITTDLTLSQICLIMDKMDHPCILYQDSIVTPWDICLILLSENLTEFSGKTYLQKRLCPHCGKEID